MNIINILECSESIERLGRIYDGPNGEVFMNWTCSGLRFHFKGTCLIAELNAYYGEEIDKVPFDGSIVKRKLFPYAAVFLDNAEEPISYFEVKEQSQNYLLFSSDKEESHVITIRKMTENSKGKLSISKFLTDGDIQKTQDIGKKLKIEFIGDSITCGFGNMSKERDHLFYSMDENGWMSHAAIAARKLKAEYNIIAYSGIAVTKGLGNMVWQAPSMPELYPYTDRLVEETYGKKNSFEEWNFNQFKPDIIVMNLGTNDATIIDFNYEINRGIQKFEEDYYQFLKMLRDKNGKEPWIICALGSMDYYLYDHIAKVVEAFSKDNNDQKIKYFKYGRIRVMDGYGACGHPNMITQERMGNEIADYIEELLQ